MTRRAGRRHPSGRSPDARAAVRGTMTLGVLQVAGRALALSLVLVATRSLPPEEFGRYAIAAALLLVAGSVADLGTTTAITKMVSANPEASGRVLTTAVPTSAGIGVVAVAGLVGFVHLGDYTPATETDVFMASLGIPAEAIATSIFGALDGRGLISRRAQLSFLRIGVIAIGGLLAVAVAGSVRLAIVALAVAPVVTLAAAVAVARQAGVWRMNIGFDVRLAHALVKQALPFAALGAINVVVLRADVVILSLLGSRREVAHYDVALRMTEAVAFVATVVAAPSLFILSRRLANGDVTGAQRAFDEATRFCYLTGLPATAVLVVLHQPIVEALFGGSYRPAGPLLAILGLQVWLAFVASVQGSLLLAGTGLGRAVRVFGVIAAATVVVETAAIVAAGARGAAVTMVGLQATVVATAARFSRRTTGVRLPLPPLGCVLGAATCAVVAVLLREAPLPVGLTGTLAVYALMVVTTKAVTRADFETLRGHLAGSG